MRISFLPGARRGRFRYLLLLSASESFLCSFGLRNARDASLGEIFRPAEPAVIGFPYIEGLSSKTLLRVSRIRKVRQSVSLKAKGERRLELKSEPRTSQRVSTPAKLVLPLILRDGETDRLKFIVSRESLTNNRRSCPSLPFITERSSSCNRRVGRTLFSLINEPDIARIRMLQRAFDQRLGRKENFAVIRERIARLSRDRDSALRRPPRSSSPRRENRSSAINLAALLGNARANVRIIELPMR